MTAFSVPRPGVLPAQWLDKAVGAGLITWDRALLPEPAIQPASVDLHLGDVAYRLRCSFLPGSHHSVEQRLEDFVMGEVDLTRDGAVLERDRPYLIPLIEELELPPEVRGKANPKSSTGRIDVFTRLLTDESHRFDQIAAGYRGRLYLEVISSTFTVKVHPGLALNQLRLMHGRAVAGDDELRQAHARHPILFRHGLRVPEPHLHLDEGVFLSLDLTDGSDGQRIVGYRAKRNSRLLDLSQIGAHDPADYWEPVVCEHGDQVVLEPEEFYLLLSTEGVSIPPEYSAEMAAYDPTSGELRTHYAGFFDPGFGYDEFGLAGSQAALEVRAHDVPFMVQNGQRVCRITFERLVEPAEMLYGESIRSSYQGQQSTLSKYFCRPQPASQLQFPIR
jgi:dCTP deaminase